MLSKQSLLESMKKLLACAKNRSTSQGIMVYEHFINKISISNDFELDDIYEAINITLSGIEAHGYFTNEEYGEVKRIREMR